MEKLEVALRVNVRSIDDQRLAVLEALGYVEIATISHATALSFKDLDDLFAVQFTFAFLRPREKLVLHAIGCRHLLLSLLNIAHLLLSR